MTTTTAVWRLERQDGTGPFRNTSTLGYTAEESSVVFFGLGVFELPAPAVIEFDQRCGTSTKEGLVEWMTPLGLKVLSKHGFKVRRYEAIATWADKHQVVFTQAGAVLVEELDVLALMPIAEQAWTQYTAEIQDHAEYAAGIELRDAECDAYRMDVEWEQAIRLMQRDQMAVRVLDATKKVKAGIWSVEDAMDFAYGFGGTRPSCCQPNPIKVAGDDLIKAAEILPRVRSGELTPNEALNLWCGYETNIKSWLRHPILDVAREMDLL